jgi:hypothetical protein
MDTMIANPGPCIIKPADPNFWPHVESLVAGFLSAKQNKNYDLARQMKFHARKHLHAHKRSIFAGGNGSGLE